MMTHFGTWHISLNVQQHIVLLIVSSLVHSAPTSGALQLLYPPLHGIDDNEHVADTRPLVPLCSVRAACRRARCIALLGPGQYVYECYIWGVADGIVARDASEADIKKAYRVGTAQL
jgi:hypothetical protein